MIELDISFTPEVEEYLMMRFDVNAKELLDFEGFYRLLKELQKGSEVLMQIVRNSEYGSSFPYCRSRRLHRSRWTP